MTSRARSASASWPSSWSTGLSANALVKMIEASLANTAASGWSFGAKAAASLAATWCDAFGVEATR